MADSPKHTRRLSAIMFTDIVGYTSLMQRDEARAAEIRRKHRKVFRDEHDQAHGEIIQYFGDGTLSTFKSGVEAVECAIRIQEEFSQEPKIPLRIGLHIGDIVYDGTEIYGDGVNLASRVENMGVSGTILLTESLNKELKNHKNISTVSLGMFEMKNVDKPQEIFAITNQGLRVPQTSEILGKQSRRKRSIAVLPFVNMSSNPDNEYFSDGMTEEIINALSRIKELNVTSRTSSFYFKGKNIPIDQIGKELNVSTILEGSIRLAGNQVRITAQLIDVQEDQHFWSERFDRSMEDIFAVQDEISLLIAERLKEHVNPEIQVEEHLSEAPEIPVDVYQEYLRARYFILKMTKSDLKTGMGIMEEISKNHPDFTLGYLGMHFGYTLMGTIGMIPSAQAFEKGAQYLQKAIELDPDQPESHLNLAWMSYLQEWDLEKAYKHVRKGLEIRPFVDLYQTMASILVTEGRIEEARENMALAMQIDPLSDVNYHLMGMTYYMEENYDKAIEYYERGFTMNFNVAVSGRELTQAYILAGRRDQALEFAKSLPKDSDEIMKLEIFTLAYAALGETEKAEEGISHFIEQFQTEQIERALFILIDCYAILGQEEELFDLIERGIKKRIPLMIYIPAEPILKPYRGNQRFREMMKQILGDKLKQLGY